MTERCIIDLREAHGLPVEYCLTHGRDIAECVKAGPDGEPEAFPETEGWVQDPVFPDIRTLSMEVTFNGVDPDLLGVLTGGALGNPPTPTFSIDVVTPIKRTFWQWLLRRPRQYQRIYIPNARLAQEGETDG